MTIEQVCDKMTEHELSIIMYPGVNQSGKGKKQPSSVRRSFELFQRQCWGNFRETGWGAYGLSERTDIILNRTELAKYGVRQS